MYYEMRTYAIKPGETQNYLQLFEEVALPIITKYAKLVGYWYTEVGELNQVIHMWEYESLDERIEKRKQLYSDPDWLEKFLPKAQPLLEKQETKLLNPANFSPIK